MKFLMMNLAFSLLLFSCGKKTPSGAQLLNSSIESPKEDSNPQNKNSQFDDHKDEIFEVSYLEPERNQNWIRKIKLNLPDAARIPVEKLVGNQWRPFTYTDKDSIFFDRDVADATQYRVNSMHESPLYEGVYDLNLTKTTIKLDKDLVVKAYRVVIPAKQNFYIGKHNLSIHCNILKLDGNISSFEIDPKNGDPSGSLFVRAEKIQGQGRVWLKGASGEAGAQGAPGLARDINEIEILRGKNGQPGGDGGRGGNIILLYSKSLEIPTDFFQSPSSLAGPGGAGGRGGLNAGETFHDVRSNRGGGVYGPSGEIAEAGKAGEAGLIFIKKISIANAQNISAFSQVAELHEIAPNQAGDPWIRKIHLKLENKQRWPVEKRHSTLAPWIAAGYTDEAGNYYDRDALEQTQYRIAQFYESEFLPALKEISLVDLLGVELKKSEHLKAHRVILRREDRLLIKNYNLIVEAKYLQLDGVIESFVKDAFDSKSSGSLIIISQEVAGQGAILLNGNSGREGVQGQSGLPFYHDYHNPIPPPQSEGKMGTRGSNGGRGGDLVIISETNQLSPTIRISNLGAQGGRGGPGGPGGLSFTEFVDTFHFGPAHWIFAKNGPEGSPGDAGNNGLLNIENY